MMLPQRYAIRCIDDLGLILRAEIIWSKVNGLPESVQDRVRRSHEQVFHFVKQPRYYSAVDEIREPHTATATGRNTSGWAKGPSGNREIGRGNWDEPTVRDFATNPLGRLPGSVWSIPSSPLTVPAHLGVDHFAAFPPELVRCIVLGWSPREVCTVCGEGRRPVTDVEREHGWIRQTVGSGGQRNPGEAVGQQVTNRALHTITGYTCACPDTTAPVTPGVILDPFMGTGTTVLVAEVLGRVGIGVDLSADYVRLARWRTTDPAERRRAAADVGDPTATRLPDLPDPAQALF
jgi:hypothetical protein